MLLLLQRSQLSLFRSSSASITNLAFPPTIVQDLEVKDEAQFITLLKSFVQAQKINLGEVVILLDKSVYFTQSVVEKEKVVEDKASQVENNKTVDTPNEIQKPRTTATDIDDQRILFVQSMPFTNVFSTVVTTGKVKTIIALNRELYEPIVKVCTDAKLNVTHIYPIQVVAELFSSKGFTTESAAQLLIDRDKFKIHNFLQSAKKDEEMITTVMPTEKKDKKRVLALIIIFVILLGTLAGLLWWTNNNTTQKKAPSVEPPDTSQVEVTQQPTPSPVATQAPQNLEQLLISTESASLAIEIINASGNALKAQTLRTQLTDVGFTSVSVGQTSALQQGATVVSVQSTVPTTLKEALLQQLQSWEYTVSFEESSDQSQPIIITLSAE